jgi:hypothetical protein
MWRYVTTDENAEKRAPLGEKVRHTYSGLVYGLVLLEGRHRTNKLFIAFGGLER